MSLQTSGVTFADPRREDVHPQASDWLARHIADLLDTGAADTLAPGKRKAITTSDIAALIYARMTSHRFCKQRPSIPSDMWPVIEHALQRGQPIPCILGHGPLKNPNNSPHPTADWAEFFAYSQLLRLDRAVREFHAPGLSITLYLDDGRAEYANHVYPTLTDAYRQSVIELTGSAPFHRVIHEVVSLKTLYQTHHWHDHLAAAEATVARWEADAANALEQQHMLDHARRNLPDFDILPETPEAAEEAIQERARQAAHRYRVAHEAEKRCGLWSDPEKLYMRYSPHAGFYQIFTLRKGSISQPWQGAGALHMLGPDKFDPLVMTRQKQTRYHQLATLDMDPRWPMLPPLPVVAEATEDVVRMTSPSTTSSGLPHAG